MSLNAIDKNAFHLEYQFLQAASKGQYETVVKLVESGVHVDITNFGLFLYYEGNDYRTPLQVSACNGHSDIVEFLINRNAALDVRDKFGLTALHLAAENGHKECVDLLLKAFCDHSPAISIAQGNINIPKLDHYIKGTTPLHLAAMNNHIECVKSLFFCGADFNAVDAKNRTPLLLASEMGWSECVFAQLENALGKQILSIPDCTGNTPLHFAVKHGMVSSVVELLRHGSDVNHLNDFGFTPLHLIVCNIQDEDSFEILKLLILEGYNTDINLRCLGDRNQTPLAQFVYLHGDKPKSLYKDDVFLEIVYFFIRYGATVDFFQFKKGGIFFENMLYKDEDNYDLLRFMVRTKAVLELRSELAQHMMSRDSRTFPRDAYREYYHNDRGIEDHHDAVVEDHHDADVEDDMEVIYVCEVRHQDPPMIHRNPSLEEVQSRHVIQPPFCDEAQIHHDPNVEDHHDPDVEDLHDPDIEVIYVSNGMRPQDPPMIRRNPSLEEVRRRHVMPPPLYDVAQIPRIPHSDIVKEKLMWFENLMMQPRQLQHYCRCTIRAHLKRIRDVHKLPIAVPLQDYILLSKD